jgi:hypothetical protein
MSFWSSDLDGGGEGLEAAPADLAAWLRDVGRSSLGEGDVGDAYDTGYSTGYETGEASGLASFSPADDIGDPYATGLEAEDLGLPVQEEGSA